MGDMDEDAMELDDTVASTSIIVHESSRKTTAQQPPDDVVILDDDDDPPPQPGPSKPADNQPGPSSKPDSNQIEVIDLVPSYNNNKCINYACKSGKEMMVAPNFCLSHYRVKNISKGRKKEICKACYEEAVLSYDQLATELKSGNLLFNLNMPLMNDTVEIDDSDEEDDQESDDDYLDADTLQFLDEQFENVLAETMEKIDFKETTKKQLDYLNQRRGKISGQITQLQQMILDTRIKLDRTQLSLYNKFKPETSSEGSITIIDCDGALDSPFVKPDEVVPQRRNTRSLAKSTTVSPAAQSAPSTSTKEPEGTDVPRDLPPIGPVEKPVLIVDGLYYVARVDNLAANWMKARLKQTYPPGTIANGKTFITPMYKIVELKQQIERIVSGKVIASMRPSKTRLEPGTRVIAVFKEIGEFRKARHDSYYPGIVAEPPVAQNRYRYLIFFDIGYSQYVSYHMVHLVVESSKEVWEDMNTDSKSFIKRYLESADRPMVKMSKGQTIRVEYNNSWVLCTVMEVDCSLALIFFDSLNRMEWIYRGSTRLRPLFKEEQNATKRHTGGRTYASSRKANDETATIVQYTKNTDFVKPTEQTATIRSNRAVARKSTARPESMSSSSSTCSTASFASNSSNGGVVPFLPPVSAANIVTLEPTSKIMVCSPPICMKEVTKYFTPRDTMITQRVYKPHNCSPACKDYLRHNLSKLRGHNPLSKPLLCGWARITMKVKGRKEIVYKAPCCRMLRNMAEVHQYLRRTKSEMTVDLFDFNHNVRCLAEFSVDCQPDPKDLSRGLEQVAVPVINGINREPLNFMHYQTRRTPTEGVQLNTDPEFLCGCDCTDDCADKTRCQCWQMTLEGSKYMGKNVDPNTIGYIYRRLHEQVLTGIYECNSRCRCSSTCLNRVVQNPMSLKLQVFRTHNRGWGIRSVNDVPQGTFICIYAGTIHTEQMANEDGVTYGDEYFAELDYIENCEKHKEDYEAEALEPESERSMSNSPADDEDDEDDEEEAHHHQPRDRSKRKYNYTVDNDFVPSTTRHLPKEKDTATMRLRKRKDDEIKEEPKKEEMDSLTGDIETVTISDDEDDPKEVLSFNPKSDDLDDDKPKNKSVRAFFKEDEPYIMDTKNTGNIGRFLNHSCCPNVFVQNVFVDTHDVRFPWVAFFCSQFIRAGTELTWNYNYDIGSVPGRVLYCHCGSLECKGRLL